MGTCVRLIAAVLLVSAAAASGQSSSPPESAPIVQPGAPGQNSKRITAEEAAPPLRAPSAVDVSFMQGMIMHHSQAVQMTDLLRVRSHSKELLELGKRISISQTDEMKFMKRWLTYRDKPLMDMAPGMSHMDMPLMPGMLTPKQMDALRKASGPKFDQLFLTGMIQHHGGALTMVKDLFDTPGAAQDMQLFDFTADIGVTQRGEIDAMRNMLAKEK